MGGWSCRCRPGQRLKRSEPREGCRQLAWYGPILSQGRGSEGNDYEASPTPAACPVQPLYPSPHRCMMPFDVVESGRNTEDQLTVDSPATTMPPVRTVLCVERCPSISPVLPSKEAAVEGARSRSRACGDWSGPPPWLDTSRLTVSMTVRVEHPERCLRLGQVLVRQEPFNQRVPSEAAYCRAISTSPTQAKLL